jgi:hypothetical protein
VVHVGAEVAAAANPLSILAAVALHQVPDGILEVGVVQRVELRQSVAQALRPHRLPPGALLAVVEPAGVGEDQDGGEDPPVGQQPVDHHRHQADTGRRHRGEDEQLRVALLVSSAGPSAASPHRPPPGHRSHRIGYWTVVCGRGVLPSPVEMSLLPGPTTAKATTAKIVVSRLASGAHRACPLTGVPSERRYGLTHGIQASLSSQLPAHRPILTGGTDNTSAHHHTERSRKRRTAQVRHSAWPCLMLRPP